MDTSEHPAFTLRRIAVELARDTALHRELERRGLTLAEWIRLQDMDPERATILEDEIRGGWPSGKSELANKIEFPS